MNIHIKPSVKREQNWHDKGRPLKTVNLTSDAILSPLSKLGPAVIKMIMIVFV